MSTRSQAIRRTIIQRLCRDSYDATTPTIGNIVVKPPSRCLISMRPPTITATAGVLSNNDSGVRCGRPRPAGSSQTMTAPISIVAAMATQKAALPVGPICVIATPVRQ